MTFHIFICVQLNDAALVELIALFPDISGNVIKDTLTASGGDASVAASRLIHWPGNVIIGVRIIQMSMLNIDSLSSSKGS